MDLTSLELKLETKFKNINLLEQALRHRSYLNEVKKENLASNERLEFLGDAILQVVVSEFLYHQFSNSPEGDLTNYRSSLVKTSTLARIADQLGLGNFLLLSKGEEEEGRENPSLLADCLEAVIGAIFIDQGLPAAQHLIHQHLLPLLPEIIKNKAFKDFKSLFQEKIQAQKKSSPFYKVLDISGPDHRRNFLVGVFSQGAKLGEGKGRSKQEAEQNAAQVALEYLTKIK